MNREKQIIEKAGKDSEIFYKVNDNYGDCFHGGFIDGAKWADEHPKEGMINKQEFIELVIGWVKNRDNVEKHLHMQTSLIDGFANALRKYLEE